MTVVMRADRRVVAAFAPRAAFCDPPADPVAAEAVAQLAARDIVRGYGDGCFGPDDGLLRAQLAGMLVRAMGWDSTPGAPASFADQDGVDAELWRAIGILAARDVARGYADGTYRPRDPVLRIQAVSFITRAMVAQGLWQPRDDDPTLYPNVSPDSGHRRDLATFVAHAGAIPGFPTHGAWSGPTGWDGPSTRAWFARLLWQALDSHFRAAREV